MSIKEALAKIKILKNISIGYLGMWVYLYIIIEAFKIDISLWVSAGFLLVCVIMTAVDWLFIFPEEQKIIYKNMRGDIDTGQNN